MNWKTTLHKLEQAKEWDLAIDFMQQIIAEHPTDLDAYLYMNFLLMNLLVEEDYNQQKYAEYVKLLKYYFDISYAQFSENPEYLFYTGMTAVMSEWYFGMEIDEIKKMIQKAYHLIPQNIIYQYSNYVYLNSNKPEEQQKVLLYARMVLDPNSSITKILQSKSALGEFVLMIMSAWSKDYIQKFGKNHII